jgi:hypothetical protein
MITLTKMNLFVFIFIFALCAENAVFTDADFPYRVVCKSEWVEQIKNDTMLIIKNTTPGKKTLLQLKKYVVAPGFDTSNKDWSRFRYTINIGIITGLGKLGFYDTTSNKKLGGNRAYELFAYFWEKTDDQTLWFAEYTRWTDFNGTGYMASIIGDTLDMKENVLNKNYVKLLDSISLSQFEPVVISEKSNLIINPVKFNTVESIGWYDILGRNLQAGFSQRPNTIIVKKNMKQCIVK